MVDKRCTAREGCDRKDTAAIKRHKVPVKVAVDELHWAMERKGEDKSKGSSDAKTSSKDIWMMMAAMEPAAPKEDQVQPQELTIDGKNGGVAEERDTFTLIVGSKNSGKTSLTANFRNSSKAEEIKPTTALDYVFVRLKTASGTGRPAVAHMWELATTKYISDMIRVPLAPERILNGALVIVVDLSVPGDAVPYLIRWLAILNKVVQDVLKAKEKNPVDKMAVDKLRQEAMARYGPSHPDKDEVTPIALPLLIVANKYDTFRDEDSVKRKGITQAIRYLAHQYGATLLFTSMKDKNLTTQFRSIMKSFAFRAISTMQKSSKEVADAAKPVFVPAGADLFEDIGMPKTARRQEFTKDQHEEKAKQWKKIVADYYPATGEVKDNFGADEEDAEAGEKENYPEPNIDRIRQRKLEELRRKPARRC
ncbi:TPA: LOW QUALITY PROTEIN: hypothetical protein N0F65_007725 [Lagenidium giganteum]|uniref:Cytoplasmic dynein 2 light intermediate chain 1 n=1 Tax=Lagenidium giganteum TaxID=4803 RepID=A0AAV2YZZ2_9STRA|nr:TPA: LOW QUALITY PROTEIN: hypothetical protein N0F65_007725 [Lagenidium giganteum]